MKLIHLIPVALLYFTCVSLVNSLPVQTSQHLPKGVCNIKQVHLIKAHVNNTSLKSPALLKELEKQDGTWENVTECCHGYIKNGAGRCVSNGCPEDTCRHGFCDDSQQCHCPSHYSLDSEGRHCVINAAEFNGTGAVCAYHFVPHRAVINQSSNGTKAGLGPILLRPELVCCPGFEKNSVGRCVASSIAACLTPCPANAVCSRGNCECDVGYTPVVEDNHGKLIQCVPQCDQCEHGRCIAPDKCVCVDGYTRVENKCVPFCPLGCSAHGKCIAPNTCVCDSGYRVTDVKSAKIECEPVCSMDCINGKCAAPNFCQCNKGHKPDINDYWRCVGECPNGCENGVCSGPNLCLCKAGYIKDRTNKLGNKCIPRS